MYVARSSAVMFLKFGAGDAAADRDTDGAGGGGGGGGLLAGDAACGGTGGTGGVERAVGDRSRLLSLP